MPGPIQMQVRFETEQIEARLTELSELLQRLPERVADGIRKRIADLPDQLVDFALGEGLRTTGAGRRDVRVYTIRLFSPVLDELCAAARGAADWSGS
ncbi:TPA: hypothetical protein U2Q23_005335 [Burkholderia multivorans]|uniref:hypothetical protein n=1 Tax=Pandoraea sp. CB10b_02 TaxID=2014535 RepID=UPI0011B1F21A|nr:MULTISPECIES: hypothetical protein [Burkholderiaceae]MBU9316561.1 hypothetical protein [Burkholderia multivorans]MCA8480213.1 hypothetical protein [Burkholderia multivorans]UXZ62490.1 hypothetical protein NUJ28_07185 [Burkholderia multivorans]HEJ2443641.1 hypothetical protein [Burkholderia multivorans]HEM7842601.1 hypothetical protein [Burkholderia multivorans]